MGTEEAVVGYAVEVQDGQQFLEIRSGLYRGPSS